MTFLMENIRVSYYIRYVSKVYEHIIKDRTAESTETYRCIVSRKRSVGKEGGEI